MSGNDSQNNYGFRYNAFGVVTSQYQNDDDDWDDDDYSGSSIHTRTNNLIPYQYTGKYRESISGFNHMDARWYNPKIGRFIQPDQYNHVNLMLPKGAQSELMRYIGRSQSDLLKDPAQQMRYGYVSGNALRWVDPLGLAEVCIPTVEKLKEIDGFSEKKVWEDSNGFIYIPTDGQNSVLISPETKFESEETMAGLLEKTLSASNKLGVSIYIMSSYRSQDEQDALRLHNARAATVSKHTTEEALDLYIPELREDGMSKSDLSKKTADSLYETGEFNRVSSYNSSNTAHVDSGEDGSGPGLYYNWEFQKR